MHALVVDKVLADGNVLTDAMFSFSLKDPGDENFSGTTFGAFAADDADDDVDVHVDAEVEVAVG